MDHGCLLESGGGGIKRGWGLIRGNLVSAFFVNSRYEQKSKNYFPACDIRIFLDILHEIHQYIDWLIGDIFLLVEFCRRLCFLSLAWFCLRKYGVRSHKNVTCISLFLML